MRPEVELTHGTKAQASRDQGARDLRDRGGGAETKGGAISHHQARGEVRRGDIPVAIWRKEEQECPSSLII